MTHTLPLHDLVIEARRLLANRQEAAAFWAVCEGLTPAQNQYALLCLYGILSVLESVEEAALVLDALEVPV
jgi:hypothetical protein